MRLMYDEERSAAPRGQVVLSREKTQTVVSSLRQAVRKEALWRCLMAHATQTVAVLDIDAAMSPYGGGHPGGRP